MAIQFARLEYVSRSSGGNACCKSAYNGREKIEFYGTKFNEARTYDYSWKEKPPHHSMMLPSQANESFQSAEHVWNLAEASENRKNSQPAMEMVLALPDDDVLSLKDRIDLAESFFQSKFVDKGFVVQLDIHPPDKKIEYSEKCDAFVETEHNWHAHALISSRKVNRDGTAFEKVKPREFNPQVRRGRVTSGTEWGKEWGVHQNQWFEDHGLDLRVDPTGIVSQEHLGPVRLRGKAESLLQEQNRRIELNEFESHEPENILGKLTERESIFSSIEVDRFLSKYLPLDKVSEVKEAFFNQPGIVQLHHADTNEASDLYSSTEVVKEERKIIRIAKRLRSQEMKIPETESSLRALERLSDEQRRAVEGILLGKRLMCLEGFAGTGKSYTLRVLADVMEGCGLKVRAFGPEHATAAVLHEKGFEEAENVYRFLFSHEVGKRPIQSGGELWIIDEASKLGNKAMLEVLRKAEANNARVVFSGCTAQMRSVDRGGMFDVFCQEFGALTLTDIKRQQGEVKRAVAKSLATGKFNYAIDLIEGTGGFKWTKSKAESLEALITQWAEDQRYFSGQSSLILAYTNKEVRVLNELVRCVRKSKGEISDEEYTCAGPYGEISVSVGDRIEFRDNDHKLGVRNGLEGVLVQCSKEEFIVKLGSNDSGKEKLVRFNPEKFCSFQLAYAKTHFRSQGQTVDRCYVLHSRHLVKEPFYVALTRHVKSAHYFISRQDARFLSDLKLQVSRTSSRPNTLNFITPSEIAQKKAERETQYEIDRLKVSSSFVDRLKGRGRSAWNSVKSSVRDKVIEFGDRSENGGFYSFNPDSQLTSGKVEKKDREAEGPSPILTEVTINLASLPSVSTHKQGRLHEGELNKVSKSSIPQAISDYLGSLEKCSQEQELAANDENKKGAWMKACGVRNETAFKLCKKFSPKELKKHLGPYMYKGVTNQAKRHESYKEASKERLVELDGKLKESMEELLFRLFPDGPTSKGGGSVRYGNKGSLSVSLSGKYRGVFYDHEYQISGGPIKLVERALNCDRKDAIKWSKEFVGMAHTISVPENYKASSTSLRGQNVWVVVKPPNGCRGPSFDQVAYGDLKKDYKEQVRYDYKDEDGKLNFHVIRAIKKDGSGGKTIRPLTYGHWKGSNGVYSWKTLGLSQELSRPLYGLEKLKPMSGKPILLVEGEKAADAAQKLFGDKYVCMTWMGGVGAISKSNWVPLFAREVYMWPDNDSAGFKAIDGVKEELRNVGVQSFKVVRQEDLQKHMPEKWDLGDPLPEGKKKDLPNTLLSLAEDKLVNPFKLYQTLRGELKLTGSLKQKDFSKFNVILCSLPLNESTDIGEREKLALRDLQKVYANGSRLLDCKNQQSATVGRNVVLENPNKVYSHRDISK